MQTQTTAADRHLAKAAACARKAAAHAAAGRRALARIYRSYADGWTLAALDA